MIRIRIVHHGRGLNSDAREHLHNLVEYLRLTLRDDHAAQLVNNENVLFGRNFSEALYKELQNIVRRLRRVLESNSHMAQHDDDVLRNQTRFAAIEMFDLITFTMIWT